eukprot:scaffold15061_cov68-Isochrysis_galbana.AAC.1
MHHPTDFSDDEDGEGDALKPRVTFRIRTAEDAVLVTGQGMPFPSLSLPPPVVPPPGGGRRRGGDSLGGGSMGGGGGLLPPPPGPGARGPPSRSPSTCCVASPNLHTSSSPNLHTSSSPNLHTSSSPNLHTSSSPNLHTSSSPMLKPSPTLHSSHRETPPPPHPSPTLQHSPDVSSRCHTHTHPTAAHPTAAHPTNGLHPSSLPASTMSAGSSAALFQLQVLERYSARFVGKARQSATAQGEVRAVPRGAAGASSPAASFRLTLCNAERVGPLQENTEVVRREAGSTGGGGD